MRPLRVLFSSTAAEKLLHQRAAFLLEHARYDIHPVIQKISIANAEAASHRARPFICGSVDQTPHASLDQSTGAHRARFDRGVDNGVGQAIIAERASGLT